MALARSTPNLRPFGKPRGSLRSGLRQNARVGVLAEAFSPVVLGARKRAASEAVILSTLRLLTTAVVSEPGAVRLRYEQVEPTSENPDGAARFKRAVGRSARARSQPSGYRVP
ncbi:hypothetical protein [Humidisolicoccus flavus]|uniref:hypothetical protein n=1 Tax=Humidisolicoccus flavus TaxID=3111414 RepID=UPI00324F8871